MSMELNIEKIDNELKRIGMSKYRLAKEIEVPIQNVIYWMKTKSIKGAEPIAKVFNLDPKDLIK